MSQLLKIMKASLKTAFLSFGGGNTAMGLIQNEFVKTYQIVSEKDFQTLLSLTNIFPGPLSINMIVMMSYQSAGIIGGIVGFFTILFPGPILVIGFIQILHSFISQEIIIKLAIGITPVIIAMLLEFIIKSFQIQLKQTSSKIFYLICFIIASILFALNINIALIFFIAISILWVLSLIFYSRKKI